MKSKTSTALSLLATGLLALSGLAFAQGESRMDVHPMGGASDTTNSPSRAGEASTMTNGVPNLTTSNVQPGELGIQTRLTVRPRRAPALAAAPNLNVMGAGPARAEGTSPTGVDAAVR